MKKLLCSSILLSLLLQTTPALGKTYSSETEGKNRRSEAIAYVQQEGILFTYADDNFYPESPLTRLEFLVAVVGQAYPDDINADCADKIAPSVPATYTHYFRDVPRNVPYGIYVCIGMFTGIVNGHDDGTFRPFEQITLAEAAKIISKAYGTTPAPSIRPNPSIPWYEPYWYALARDKALPGTYHRKLQKLTRGDGSEIIYALRDRKPARGFIYRAERSVSIIDLKIENSPVLSQKVMNGTTGTLEQSIKEALEALRKDKNSTLDLYKAKYFETDRRLSQSLRNPNFVRKYRGELRSIGLIEEQQE